MQISLGLIAAREAGWQTHDDDGKRVRVSYAYWNSTDGCGGWEPARGNRFTFDLADDKSADGALRVMRYGAGPGAR